MTVRRGGLGGGLEALIPTGATDGESSFAHLSLDDVEPNPNQPRATFDDEALSNLAASIREVGVLQPIVVTRVGDRYQLIAGERRLRACRRAGLTEIPAVVRTVDDLSSLTQALIENVQRQDLSPLEEAAAYHQLLEDHGLTHDEIGTRVGKSRATITNSLRLMALSPVLQGMLERRELSAGHARALLGVDDQKYAEHIAKRAVDEGWSVRQVEEAARARRGQDVEGQEPAQVREVRPVEIIELENRLTDQLGSRVKIQYRNKKGTIELGFASLDDLERLYRRFFSR
jgi:ParB family chromosome partitioning protein